MPEKQGRGWPVLGNRRSRRPSSKRAILVRQPGFFGNEAAAERALRIVAVFARFAVAHAELVQRLVHRLEAGRGEPGHRSGKRCRRAGETPRSGRLLGAARPRGWRTGQIVVRVARNVGSRSTTIRRVFKV